MKKRGLMYELRKLDENTFFDIPLGNMHETSITDNLLTTMIKSGGDFIKHNPRCKETGKHGTSADYVLIIRDSSGKTHELAFQAKVGKVKNKKFGNFYQEINHDINKSDKYKPRKYQLDVFGEYLKYHPNVSGYYIFYNGDFTDSKYSNCNDTIKLKHKSFWIYPQDKVLNIVKSISNPSIGYKSFGIDKVVNHSSYESFQSFLNKY